ncbi:MAG: AraC family transcriptional regulator [Bacteroidota bacterium]
MRLEEGLLMSVFRVLGHPTEELPQTINSNQCILTIDSLIEKRLNDPYFGAGQLADLMGMSEKGLARICREVTGNTPSKYILKKRLEYSRKLIAVSEEPLQNIATDSGFMSYSGFWKAFRRNFGLTPQQYRTDNHIELKTQTLEWDISLLAEESAQLVTLLRQQPVIAKLFKELLIQIPVSGVALETLSDHLNTSTVSLIRLTKENLEVTPMKLLQQLRLLFAAELLYDSANSIASIAFSAGFFDQAHFTRSFKMLFGLTPGAFRKTGITISGIDWLKEVLLTEMSNNL